ncbi:MAG TPA: thioredoxin family protein [Candidatus Cybelea sp.]|nr:thioredoxin family protein [Candidatus Cybelea sp.]
MDQVVDQTEPKVVSRDQWLEARLALLAREKELSRLGDELAEQRRKLPWVKVEKTYTFDGPKGRETLADLFGDCSQLAVYHFMFAPDWEEGCKSCSFWADNINGTDIHLKHRDISFVAISRAPLAKLEAYKRRLGWSFKWVSSDDGDFNYDFGVSFTPAQRAKGELAYNYATLKMQMSDLPGISVFAKDAAGQVYHTYSSFGRGVEAINGAYRFIDLTPRGRHEEGKGMAWLRRHDDYED